MAQVYRTPQAEADLAEILEYLHKNSPSLAEQYARSISEKSQVLSRFPAMGRRRPEIASELRSTLVKPYVNFYRIKDDIVQILRILHGKRDLRKILQEESEE
jgi:toxin ParE1/3/4